MIVHTARTFDTDLQELARKIVDMGHRHSGVRETCTMCDGSHKAL